MSSFNYPATADPSLLTPVSNSASPSLEQRQMSKTMRNFHHSHSAAPGAQIPTPPNTSKMYYGTYPDMNNSSQGSSPLAIHPQVTEFEMSSYLAHSPPGGHHPSSPRLEVPPPADHYLGHFTVSGGTNEPEVDHRAFHDYSQYPTVDPGLFVRHPSHHVPVSAPHAGHLMHISRVGTPMMAHQAHFGQDPVPRIEDIRGNPSLHLGPYPPQHSTARGRAPPRKKAAPPPRKVAGTPKGALEGDLVTGEDGEELTLRDDAPEDDKYLFQLRKEFIAEKGKGMWEEMKAKYSEKHQGNWEKAALQMKVSRAVAKYGVWPKTEVSPLPLSHPPPVADLFPQIERLREAHQYFEEKRYQMILAHMKENGGCRVWDWKPQHIEAMLVKLGVEEATVDEKTGNRRRNKKLARRRTTSTQNTHQHHTQNMMNDWPNALGLHPGYHQHPHMAHQQHRASFEMLADDGIPPPAFSPEQENEILDQIYSKQPPQAESSMSPDMGFHEEDDGNSNTNSNSRPSTRGLGHNQSERVAKQACEQLMQHQQARNMGHLYAS